MYFYSWYIEQNQYCSKIQGIVFILIWHNLKKLEYTKIYIILSVPFLIRKQAAKPSGESVSHRYTDDMPPS